MFVLNHLFYWLNVQSASTKWRKEEPEIFWRAAPLLNGASQVHMEQSVGCGFTTSSRWWLMRARGWDFFSWLGGGCRAGLWEMTKGHVPALRPTLSPMLCQNAIDDRI